MHYSLVMVRSISFALAALTLAGCVVGDAGNPVAADDDTTLSEPDADDSGATEEEDEPDDLTADPDTTGSNEKSTTVITAVDGTGWRIEFVPNDPAPGASDSAIEDQFARLVAAVPAGSEIRAGFYDMGSNIASKPYTSLASAVQRGVTVRMVHDGKADAAGTNAKRLASAIGGADFHFCGHANNSACISTKGGTIMHAKYALLSRTQDSTGRAWTYATWLASANFSATSGKKSQNNAIIVYGDATLYGKLRDGLFNKQFNNAGPTSAIASGATGDAGVTVYGIPYTDATTDVWAQRLAPFLEPTSQAGCVVVAASPDFSDGRLAVAKQLAKLKQRGCSVTVYTRAASRLGAEVKDALDAAGVPHRVQPTLHDKMIAIRARTSTGGALRPFVFAGSLNLKTSNSDELLVKVEAQKLFDAAVSHLALD